ncbi:MAG TPA: excinuclease ABC subunit A, partial [Phycisphaerae bacterium]|nr:excinuclease ABC subunit A [Phycisphaerae bacterium]
TGGWNPRSTVGTITQINDYLRVLFARIGRQHCPKCGRPISAQSREAILARIGELPQGTHFLVLAPVVRGQKGEHRDLLSDMRRRGYVRARIDGRVEEIESLRSLDGKVRHDIEIVIDRLTRNGDNRARLAEAVEKALELGEGTLIIAAAKEGASLSDRGGRAAGQGAAEGRGPHRRSKPASGDLVLSSKYACTDCGIGFEPPSPQLLSFNSPIGMCLRCDGIGTSYEFDPELLVPDPNLNFLSPCIAPMRTTPGRWRRHIYQGVAKHLGINLLTPWKDLPEQARHALLYGTGDEHIAFEWRGFGGTWRHGGTFEGVIAELEDKYRKAKAGSVRAYYEKYMRVRQCKECNGARLNPQALAVRIQGKNIHEVGEMSIRQARQFFADLPLTPTEAVIAEDVLREIRGRLEFLEDVGLDYLTLNRTAPSLSGGESQRIRLAGQIGCGLVGVLYVLDEPSIGLHARDNRRLLDSLVRLRDMGNTVIVVEHDEETMRSADLIVDFGPGPGVRGGEVVAVGTLDELAKETKSITADYLTGRTCIEVPARRRPISVADRSPSDGREAAADGAAGRKRGVARIPETAVAKGRKRRPRQRGTQEGRS